MAWTKEQELAINTKNCSLLVAAAAGAGKTAVLVERIIKKLTDETDPIDIDRLLVVTYTNAAASEMRERIGEALSKELEKKPDSDRLQRQNALLGRASITTVHSFCLDVIKNNFHTIDLDPVFRIADNTESILLKQEVLEELFDSRYEDPEDEFLKLVERYGGSRSDAGLQEMVLRLYEFSQSTPYPGEWLFNAAEKFNVDEGFEFGKSLWASVILEDLKIELPGLLNAYERALSITDGLSDFEGYYNHLKMEQDKLKDLLNNWVDDWDIMVERFGGFTFDNLPRAKKGSDEEIKKQVSDLRTGVKDMINSIRGGIMSSNSDKIADEMKKLYPSMKALSSLVLEFGARFKEKKKEKGLLDFNDIEHYCIEILAEKEDDGRLMPTPAALRYRDRFQEVLVDEYQDSNMVQETILSMVSRKDSDVPNLFMVGDVKQSIYRFRQARPELFLEKYGRFAGTGRERKILLYKNFRSRKEILDGSNYIFKSIMSKNIGELEYTDDEKLNCGAEYPPPTDGIGSYGGPVELHIIENLKSESAIQEAEEGEETQEEEEDLDSLQLEARAVAGRIKRLISEEGFMVSCRERNIDGGESTSYRPLTYRDIVILMRAVSSAAPVFMEELDKQGIPVYSDAGSGYFEVVEVQTIVSLLEIIDNPMQDIPLIAVLRSPIASFTPEELIDIRLTDTKKSYFDALKLKACEGTGETSKKAQSFLNELSGWRKKSKVMPISEFIWYLYRVTGYFAYAGAMPGGVQRQGNLRILFERARQYEETSYRGLFNFINFIKKLKDNSGDMAEARTLGENENVVRIMSIHKSKGLEFPVVFVSGLGKRFNLKDLERKVLFHHDLGLGPDYVDSEKRFSYPTVVKQALKKKLRLENYSEEMRILYVAMTRAREKLILTGVTGNMEKAFIRWSEGVYFPGNRVPEYQILKGDNFLDWICPALIKHEKSKEFREAANVTVPPGSMAEDSSVWEIHMSGREDIIKDRNILLSEAAVGSENDGGGKYYDEIKRRLEYKYPYIKSSMIHAKLTVTELKKMFGTTLGDEYTEHIFVPEIIKKPAFLEGEGKLSAAERGTTMHLVMQHIPMDKPPAEEDIKSLLENMTQEEFMTGEQKSTVDIKRIVKFFESPLGLRLLKAKNVKRETPFYMEIEGRDVYKDLDGDAYKDEKVILQGVIDCFFEEDDGLVLIDYKTDYVPDGNTDIIKERYRLQIDYYAKALERLTEKKVKEKYIYLFYNGEVIEF